MHLIAGINGFGRFGLHLLKYWLDRNHNCPFSINYINDDMLTLKDAFNIITSDEYVSFNKYKILITEDSIMCLEPNGSKHIIEFTTQPVENISWLGKPHLIFECSGKNTIAKNNNIFLKGETYLVLISATSYDADQTLIYGFNHTELNSKSRIISYGSCTVNAYVPFANFIHKKFGILDSDVNIIHNIQGYKLIDCFTLKRKSCTLERSLPQLLPFLNSENFTVNYTIIPYSGVSIIDFRFRIKSPSNRSCIIDELEQAFSEGTFKNLYTFNEVDLGPEVNSCTTFSTVFIKKNIKVLRDNIYFHGYCDTENSVNRYFDLACYISKSNVD